ADRQGNEALDLDEDRLTGRRSGLREPGPSEHEECGREAASQAPGYHLNHRAVSVAGDVERPKDGDPPRTRTLNPGKRGHDVPPCVYAGGAATARRRGTIRHIA